MNWLDVYIWATPVSIAISVVEDLSVRTKLKKAGYVETGRFKNMTVSEKLSLILSNTFKLLFPGYMPLNALVILFADKDWIFQVCKEDYIKKGFYERKSQDKCESIRTSENGIPANSIGSIKSTDSKKVADTIEKIEILRDAKENLIPTQNSDSKDHGSLTR